MAGTYNLGTAVGTIVVNANTKGVDDAADAVEDLGKKGDTGLDTLKRGFGLVAGAAAAVTAAAVVAGGAIFSMGMDRAVAIENAEAKMRGLGYTTEQVEGIMGNALAAVKGTAFGLDEAATIAATAVAAGIEPGEQLERQLKLITNAAAASGTGLDEMGSIMRKVWTQGKVDTEVMNQLADRGIPIYSKLAEAYGVSGEELREMVSNGQVDLETFTGVLENSVGTVADEMGKTFTGASANAQAALSRLGAQAAEKLLPHLTEILNMVMTLADEFGSRFGPMIAEVADNVGSFLVSAVKGAIDAFSNMMSFIKDNTTWLGPLAAAIGAAAVALGLWNGAIALWSAATKAAAAIQAAFNLVMNANPIMLIVTAIAALVAGLVYFFTQTELGQQIWANFTQFLGEAWTNISTFLTEAWTNISTFFVDTWNNIATFFTDLWEGIVTFITGVVTGIVGTFTDWGNTITGWWDGLWAGVRTVFETIWSAIQTYIQTIVGVIKGIFTGDFSSVPGIIQDIWNKAKQFTEDVWNNIIAWLGSVPGWVLDVFKGAGEWLFGIGEDILNGLWNGLKSIWDGLVGWIEDIGQSVADTFAGVLGIHSPSRVFAGFGKDIMQGLINGIDSEEAVVSAQVRGIGTGLSSDMQATINAMPTSADGNSAVIAAEALISDEAMRLFAREVATETASAILDLRFADARNAELVVKQSVR